MASSLHVSRSRSDQGHVAGVNADLVRARRQIYWRRAWRERRQHVELVFYHEAKAELRLLPRRTRFVAKRSCSCSPAALASSLYYHCSFGRFGGRRIARAPLVVARAAPSRKPPRPRASVSIRPCCLPCGDVTPLPLALSAAGRAGTTRRGRSRSGALLSAAALSQRRQRLRLAGHGCARFVAFTPLKSQCSYVASFFCRRAF